MLDLLNSVNIFHHNTRELRNKSDELINSFVLDSINPHILCLSEFHVEEQDLLNLTLSGYSLGSSYCHRNLQKGGVCILVREDQSFKKIDTSLHCAEQTLEVCSVELGTKSSSLRVLSLYRAPSAKCNQFIERLDATLKYLYNP
jgi:rRNA maturation protein Rpf1